MPHMTVRTVTRTQYRQARRQIRAKGRCHALASMDAATRAAMELVIDASIGTDPLAKRARAALRQAVAIN